MAKPILLKILIFVIVFQAISGLAGGIGLTFSPSGESIQMPISLLDNTPFNNFLIPGFFLLIVLGVFPAALGYAMIREPEWKFPNKLNVYLNLNYLWTYSLYLGLILVSWIIIQVYLIGGGHIFQLIYGLLGVLILILALSPQVMNYYSLNND